MKKKLKPINLPLIHPDMNTHYDFFSVCIKAIEENKDGVIDKKECIENILKLKEQKLKKQKKNIHKISSMISIRSKTAFKTNTIINKRRTLSQILLEIEKNETQRMLKQNLNKILDKNEKNKKQIKGSKENNSDNIDLKKVSNKNISSSKYNVGIKYYKITINANISNRYLVFKKIIEYLESNNITLFELLKRNPFQKKPYEISKGYEFLDAVKFKNYEFVREALHKSNDYLFVFDCYGQTCYHWAAKLGNIKMLRMLLDYGLHHNQKDFKGRTPLYLAAVNNDREVCDILLRHKANIHLKDKNGKSASDVAGSKELKFYLGDVMTQPYSNPIYKKRVADYLRDREERIEKARLKKRLLEIEKERKENEEYWDN
jgi:effector-binding domain-containing protein